MPALRLEEVTKRFGAHVAVDALSLTVPEGVIYGFLGPNGSGKTTTLRMALRILLPDAGVVEVLGERTGSAAHDRVAYLPEERGLYRRWKVRRLLRYLGELKGRSGASLDRAITEWLERMGLAAVAEKRVEQLSKGMAQKIQFIGAALAEPRLLILDEPFSGLDPVNAVVLRDAVVELRRRGVTIVLSTHDMAVAERMCDRLLMIHKGKKVLDGTLDEIQAAHGAPRVRVRCAGGREALAGAPGVARVVDHGQLQEVELAGDAQAVLQHLAARTTVSLFEVARPSLHEIFVGVARPDATTMDGFRGEAS